MSSQWFRVRSIHCRVCLCGGGTLVKVEKDIYQHKDERFCKAAKVQQKRLQQQLDNRAVLMAGVAPA